MGRTGICSQNKFWSLSWGSVFNVKQPDGKVLSVGERIPRAHVRVGTYADTMRLDPVGGGFARFLQRPAAARG